MDKKDQNQKKKLDGMMVARVIIFMENSRDKNEKNKHNSAQKSEGLFKQVAFELISLTIRGPVPHVDHHLSATMTQCGMD